MNHIYNYNKLKGRIKEYFGTQEEFAKAMNLTPTSINNKLNNKTSWSQDEIFDCIPLLHISKDEVQEIFFTQIVEKN